MFSRCFSLFTHSLACTVSTAITLWHSLSLPLTVYHIVHVVNDDCLTIVEQKVPKVPLIPKVAHPGDSRHFDTYDELPDSAFDARDTDVDVNNDFIDF